jgi:hypothetical protein
MIDRDYAIDHNSITLFAYEKSKVKGNHILWIHQQYFSLYEAISLTFNMPDYLFIHAKYFRIGPYFNPIIVKEIYVT